MQPHCKYTSTTIKRLGHKPASEVKMKGPLRPLNKRSLITESQNGRTDPDGTERTLLVEEEDHTGMILAVLAILIVVIVVALFVYNKQKKQKT